MLANVSSAAAGDLALWVFSCLTVTSCSGDISLSLFLSLTCALRYQHVALIDLTWIGAQLYRCNLVGTFKSTRPVSVESQMCWHVFISVSSWFCGLLVSGWKNRRATELIHSDETHLSPLTHWCEHTVWPQNHCVMFWARARYHE